MRIDRCVTDPRHALHRNRLAQTDATEPLDLRAVRGDRQQGLFQFGSFALPDVRHRRARPEPFHGDGQHRPALLDCPRRPVRGLLMYPEKRLHSLADRRIGRGVGLRHGGALSDCQRPREVVGLQPLGMLQDRLVRADPGLPEFIEHRRDAVLVFRPRQAGRGEEGVKLSPCIVRTEQMPELAVPLLHHRERVRKRLPLVCGQRAARVDPALPVFQLRPEVIPDFRP